jgi:hypothetical protein
VYGVGCFDSPSPESRCGLSAGATTLLRALGFKGEKNEVIRFGFKSKAHCAMHQQSGRQCKLAGSLSIIHDEAVCGERPSYVFACKHCSNTYQSTQAVGHHVAKATSCQEASVEAILD